MVIFRFLVITCLFLTPALKYEVHRYINLVTYINVLFTLCIVIHHLHFELRLELSVLWDSPERSFETLEL